MGCEDLGVGGAAPVGTLISGSCEEEVDSPAFSSSSGVASFLLAATRESRSLPERTDKSHTRMSLSEDPVTRI